jgi:allophanate hydrolase
MVPTAPTIYTIAEVEADPIVKNSHMGAYTNFVNFADLSALALPNAIRTDGLPSGVTFIAAAWHDQALANFAQIWQAETALTLGKSTQTYSKTMEIESQHAVTCCCGSASLRNATEFSAHHPSRTLLKKPKPQPVINFSH